MNERIGQQNDQNFIQIPFDNGLNYNFVFMYWALYHCFEIITILELFYPEVKNVN